MKYIYCFMGIVAGLIAGGVTAQELTRAELPEVKVGDRWVMKSRDVASGTDRQPIGITVTSVTADTIVVQSGQRNERTYSREWNFRENRREGKVNSSASPQWLFYSFPLEVGKKWQGSWESVSSSQTTRWSGKAEVERVESVTVPAGTFQAFRIRFEGHYNAQSNTSPNSWNGSRSETAWYVPSVKRAVKTEWQEFGSNYNHRELNELQSYRLVH